MEDEYVVIIINVDEAYLLTNSITKYDFTSN